MFRIGEEELEEIRKVFESKNLFKVNDGLQEVVNFEKELCQKTGVDYSLLMSGGTGALIAALVGLDVGPGDEVLVPAYTFMATALAPLAVGAIPVLVDIDESMTIDVEDIKRKITPNTKAIMPVHICGFPCNMDEIMKIAKEHQLYVVEDACQADGGSYKGKRLGSIGDIGTYSFNHFKIISAGEGGAILTNNRRAYERALIYHDGGAAFRPNKGEISEPFFTGTQMRVGEVTGAILRKQLLRLDGILEDLRRIKKTIMSELAGVPNIRFSKSYDLDGDCGTHIPLAFESEEKAIRFSEISGITGRPIDSGKHVYTNWTPIMEKRGAFNDCFNAFKIEKNRELFDNCYPDACPTTLDLLKRTAYIALNPDMTEAQVNEIIEKCKKAAAGV